MKDTLINNPELWNLFTRREEYNSKMHDKFGRFLYYMSGEKTLFEPTVSKYLIEHGLEVSYPSDHKFAVCLTHDIDSIHPYVNNQSLIRGILKSLKNHKIQEAIKSPFYRINPNWNPLLNIKEIMNLEEQYGAKSSFYLLALDEGEEDFDYNIEDLRNEIAKAIGRGWEIGLHGGHTSYNNFNNIMKEKNKLEKVTGKNIIGYRNHYLRFLTPDTWEILNKAGFQYDVTFGYADCVGFRNGMCHPFKPYNLTTNKEINILEIPLAIMDTTLFGYMRLDNYEAWNTIKLLIDTVEKYNGVITILWHNTSMFEDNLKMYEKILKYCKEKDAWMTSGENIYNLYKSMNV